MSHAADELHIYGPDSGHWVMGGPLVPGLSRADALARVRRCAAPGAAVWYRWCGAGDARLLPADDGRELPDLEVFAKDARDRHLAGFEAPSESELLPQDRPRGKRFGDIDHELAHARWLRRCGWCGDRPITDGLGCPACGRK